MFLNVKVLDWNSLRSNASEKSPPQTIARKVDFSELCLLQGTQFAHLGAKHWTLTFFSQTFRAPPGYPRKIPGYPAPIPNFLAPPLHVEDPYPTGNIQTQKFGFVLFFSYLNIVQKTLNSKSIENKIRVGGLWSRGATRPEVEKWACS